MDMATFIAQIMSTVCESMTKTKRPALLSAAQNDKRNVYSLVVFITTLRVTCGHFQHVQTKLRSLIYEGWLL